MKYFRDNPAALYYLLAATALILPIVYQIMKG